MGCITLTTLRRVLSTSFTTNTQISLQVVYTSLYLNISVSMRVNTLNSALTTVHNTLCSHVRTFSYKYHTISCCKVEWIFSGHLFIFSSFYFLCFLYMCLPTIPRRILVHILCRLFMLIKCFMYVYTLVIMANTLISFPPA